MATTTNFGWETPDDTDLVKDGALAIRTLGSAIDTSLVDLRGGTTGQVLSKASNTDMDFTWVTQDDANAIQNAIVDAKGDLIAASAADTPARLAVGTDGQILTADSTTATGLKWATAAAGGGVNPNLIINGNFTINQRAYTSGTNLASGSYGFDRWKSSYTNTALTFTTAPAGQSVTISTNGVITQIVERANMPAGTYTLSWTGTATGRIYNSGSTAPSYAASPITFTGDGLADVVVDFTAVSTTKTLSKVKLELGSTATSFSYAGGTLQGEIAACQRYYYLAVANDSRGLIGGGQYNGATTVDGLIPFPTTMRTEPTLVSTTGTNYYVFRANATDDTFDSLLLMGEVTTNFGGVYQTSGVSGTSGHSGNLYTNNTAASVAFSAEL